MNGALHNGVIHQAFFGWSNQEGQLTLLAHSFSQQDDRQPGRWLGRLGTHIRLEPVHGTALPRQALSCFHFDDGLAAVLRRVDTGHSMGRNNSHALIGSATELSSLTALGLSDWNGWRDLQPSERMSPIPVERLRSEPAMAAERLLPLAEQHQEELVAVLARLLDSPGPPLSILDCPEEIKLAIVWGLRGAADAQLRSQGRNKTWSFSTYEELHDVSITGLPEVIFMPARQEGAGVVHRTTIELGYLRPSSQNDELARELVASFLDASSSPGTAPAHISVPVARKREERYPSTNGDQKEPQLVGRRTEQSEYGKKQLEPADQKPILALLRADSVRAFDVELSKLERSAQSLDHREKLRSALDVDTMDAVVRIVEVSARNEMLARLLRAAYGQNMKDLSDHRALKHAARLVKNSQSDQLAMMLGLQAPPSGETIREAAYQRWTAQAGEVSLDPSGRILWNRSVTRRGRQLPMVAGVAVVALLAVGFVLGILAGRSAPNSQDPPTPSATTTAASTLTSGPVPTSASELPSFGKAVVEPGAGQKVFGFVRNGDLYQPQAPCSSKDGTTWRCPIYTPLITTTSGIVPIPVAVLVPTGQVKDLTEKAETGVSIPRPSEGWGDDVSMF